MISIIIPTLNEADNLRILIPRIAKVMKGKYEIIIVDDDSQDDTKDVVDDLGYVGFV